MLQFLSGHRLCDISSDLEQSLVHSVLQLNGWSMKDCLPLYTFPTLLFSSPLISGVLSSLAEILQVSWSWAASWGVCMYAGILTKDRESVSGQLVLASYFLGILSSPKGDRTYIKLCHSSWILSTPFLRTLLLQLPPPLCHSRCIHASLATSRCGRNVAFIYE